MGSADQADQDGQSHDQADAGPERVKLLPGQILPTLGPAGDSDRGQDTDDERSGYHPEPGLQDRSRHIETAGVEEERAEDGDALPHAGQRGENAEIPEYDLSQQRDVADDVDIGGGKR